MPIIIHKQDVTFTAGQVETALCLWEAWQDMWLMRDTGGKPSEISELISGYHDEHGSFTMRSAIASLVEDCDQAWEAATALDPEREHGAFDFEFCPEFLTALIKQPNSALDQAIRYQYMRVEDIIQERLAA